MRKRTPHNSHMWDKCEPYAILYWKKNLNLNNIFIIPNGGEDGILAAL